MKVLHRLAQVESPDSVVIQSGGEQRSMRKVKLYGSVFAFFLLFMGFGVISASAQQQPQTSSKPSPNATPPTNGNGNFPPSSPESSLAAVDPNKYLIGPEDLLWIKTWREADFTQVAPVRPDGKITISLIGDVQA